MKDLNEFELANFSYEADYLRVFVPSNAYVRTFSNQFSTALDLRPAALWNNAKGTKGFVARFSKGLLARGSKDRRNRCTRGHEPVGLRSIGLQPHGLFLFGPQHFLLQPYQSEVEYRSHFLQSDRSQSLLLNGFESRSRQFNTVRMRWNTTRQWTADVELERGIVSNRSDLLVGRTYAVDQQGLKPRLTWQPNTSFRIMTSFKYTEKKNQAEFGGNAKIEDFGAELRYNTAGKGSILVTANRVAITYDGESNSPLGNELLSGLKIGTNMTWSVSIQRNLSNNLQVDLTYNGRRSEGVPLVHVGGAPSCGRSSDTDREGSRTRPTNYNGLTR